MITYCRLALISSLNTIKLSNARRAKRESCARLASFVIPPSVCGVLIRSEEHTSESSHCSESRMPSSA
mgnify:CR=1 FL=1